MLCMLHKVLGVTRTSDCLESRQVLLMLFDSSTLKCRIYSRFDHNEADTEALKQIVSFS